MHARQVLPPPRALRIRRRAVRQGRRGEGGDHHGGPARQPAQGTKRHQPPVQAQAHAGGGGRTAASDGGDEAHRRRAHHPAQLPRQGRTQKTATAQVGAT